MRMNVAVFLLLSLGLVCSLDFSSLFSVLPFLGYKLEISNKDDRTSEKVSQNDVIDNEVTWKDERLNQRPIIGILSQGLPDSLRRMFPRENYSSYIAASYVKFIESSGAQVVPILVNQSSQYYSERFNSLNGLVLPGGGSDLQNSGYANAAKQIWKLAAGSDDYFPILGICLGFEMLTVLKLKNNVLADCSVENIAMPLRLASFGQRSRMFKGADSSFIRMAETNDVTINFHRKCLTEDAFRSSDLHRDYDIVAKNGKGRDEFISAIEHKAKPVYGVQFHPEKNIFEWGRKPSLSNIPHSQAAVEFAQYLGRFFVNEARKSRHRSPPSVIEDRKLIYNYPRQYTGIRGSSFTEVYFFR